MATSPRMVLGLGAAVLAMSLAACSSSKATSSKTDSPTVNSNNTASARSATPSASSSAPTTDYTSLLIGAADVPVPGVRAGTPSAPPQGAGASVAFTATGGRTLGDTVLILPDVASATTAKQSAITAAKNGVADAAVSDAPIGGGGTAIRGTNGSGSVAILVFSEGKALVVLQFESRASDPVPTTLIQQVATAQDAKIKSGLTS